MMVRLFLVIFALFGSAAFAQERVPSTCLAIAQDLTNELPVQFASFKQSASAKYDVTLSFQGHSMYMIESPGGTKVITDYAGWTTDQVVPDAVTMNNAHSTHWTASPDPSIKYIFQGWPQNGDIARHHAMVGDVLIRNVTTDILRFGTNPDGNSIFIFEAGGLCIGHLGHLHHKLSQDHFTKIGRLDIVMVPVDNGMTMSHVSAKEIIQRLRSSVILPMHVRSYGALPQFLAYMNEYPVQTLSSNKITFSLRTLPKTPTIYVLAGLGGYTPPDDD